MVECVAVHFEVILDALMDLKVPFIRGSVPRLQPEKGKFDGGYGRVEDADLGVGSTHSIVISLRIYLSEVVMVVEELSS